MIDIYMLEQLKVFAEEGTLTKTAETINTSQPSLTRSMKRLEDELGVTLFTRRKKSLRTDPNRKSGSRICCPYPVSHTGLQNVCPFIRQEPSYLIYRVLRTGTSGRSHPCHYQSL